MCWKARSPFSLANSDFVARPGTFANIPTGCLHSFRNESGKPARMLISIAPAGLEKMFFEVGQPLSAGRSGAAPLERRDPEAAGDRTAVRC